MSLPGSGPGPARRGACVAAALVTLAGTVSLMGAVFGDRAAASPHSTTTTTNPWVPGVNGTMTVGIDEAPTGCNPNTASGDTWADRLVLEAVLPSAFEITSNDQAIYDSAIITQAELQSTSPETVVYTINPKAVWSDGKPVTATDFVYAWEQERGATGPVGAPNPTTSATPPSTKTRTATTSGTATATGTTGTSTTGASTTTVPATLPTTLPGATGTTGPAVGYRQIESVKGSNHGRTVTVVFKTPYADWQSLFDDLLPAHVLENSGWDPTCSTVERSIDLSAGPFEIAKVVAGKEIVLDRNPRWWQQEPPLARIVIRVASGPAQLAQWLAAGTIDVSLAGAYEESYLEDLTSQPSVATQSQVSTTFLELEMSTTSAATAAVDVRQAIAHAIDRQSLVNQVVGWADSTIVPSASYLYAQPQDGYPSHKPPPLQVSLQPGATTTTVPTHSSTTSTFPSTADLSDTSKLLTSLGYFKTADGRWEGLTGKPLSLHMAIDSADGWASQSAALVEHQLDLAGISVTQVTEPSAQAAGEALSSGKVDMALLPLHASPYASQAIGWYTPLLGPPGTGGSQDWSNLDDPSLNVELEKASQELNPVDATPLYNQVDAALWQDMPGLPLFAEPSVLAWSGVTDGVAPNTSEPSFLWAADSWALRVPPTSKDTEGS